MQIAVSGSIATDHLMTFQGRFREQLLPDQLDSVSLSFLVDELDIRRGGVAANICFGMGQLGLRPLLLGSVGADFEGYRAWLTEAGVDCAAVRVSRSRHTARFICTTDLEQNQIASFYAGAMAEAGEHGLDGLDPDLVVVAPNAPAAMERHTRECRERGIPFAADPSQQLARLEGPQIRALLEGAAYLFTNGYESGLVMAKTGWSERQVLDHVDVRVVTHGGQGVVVHQRQQAPVRVAAVPARQVADPTGVGDAFRAGFLAARSWGLGLERSAQVGCCLATQVVETVGNQEYVVDADAFAARLGAAYGDDAAADVHRHLDRSALPSGVGTGR